jgi:prophage DNA circulation protein
MSISKITDIPNTKWRDELLPASFRGALFHVQLGTKESGRRIALHEFPKKDTPYAEDMGRRARAFTVRGYCIVFPTDTDIPLYRRDYRVARDQLITELEQSDPGVLQLPTIEPVTVVCPQYRWSEEERAGGFCIFDMTFVEFGYPPSAPQLSGSSNLKAYSLDMKDRILTVMTGLEAKTRATAAQTPRMIP